MNKGFRDLLQALKKDQIPVSHIDDTGKHIKVYLQDGKMFTSSRTPSCHRGLKNFLSDVRRHLDRKVQH